jgi:membrane protein implicated in regulation of membrane protease activity
MLVLGLILVLIAVLVVLGALAGGNDPAALDIGPLALSVSVFTVFLIGAATLLLLVVGVTLIRSGTRRANQRRREHKQLTRLEKKLDQQQGSGAAPAGDTGSAGSTGSAANTGSAGSPPPAR